MWDYSEYEHLKIEVANRIATGTLNRPDRLNAVSSRLHHELENVWLDLGADRDVNAILLTGAGRAFCAGGDVRGMGEGEMMTGKQKRGALRSWGDRGGQRPAHHREHARRRAADYRRDQRRRDRVWAPRWRCCATSSWCRRRRALPILHVKIGVVAGDGGAVIWPLLIGLASRRKEFLTAAATSSMGAEAGRIGYGELPAARGRR